MSRTLGPLTGNPNAPYHETKPEPKSPFDKLFFPHLDWLWERRHSRFWRMSPNLLTASRLLIVAIAPFLFFSARAGNMKGVAVWTGAILLLALTDALDGTFARLLMVASSFGAMIDPILDKLYSFVLWGFMWFLFRDLGTPSSLAILFGVRVSIELVLLFVSPFFKKRGWRVQANQFGKIKFLIDVVMIVCSYPLIAAANGEHLTSGPAFATATSLLALASIFGFLSLHGYWVRRFDPLD